MTEARPSWRLPLLLIFLTFVSTSFVGALREDPRFFESWNLAAGASFSLPLMAILLAHEFGHYLAAKKHGVLTSPPYFIPFPFFLLGTMGAVIAIRERIRDRNALLDIGAAGPLAGLVVALPVIIYGIMESPVHQLPTTGSYLMEGRSLLYAALIRVIKGPLPEGSDIVLSSTALAGWAGLLVTMINLIPVGQLDGGHVAYALFGEKQRGLSKRFRDLLPLCALVIGLAYGVPALIAGKSGAPLWSELLAGLHWLVWWVVLKVMTRLSGSEHPETDPGTLSSKRRLVAVVTLVIFLLLFMPSWMREVVVQG
ncbi:MAG: site-2 protease family protein [Deltaproteobacteria bacterium]|nr:site-2 protease family protein [Deltaproteobacteria bacterium]